MVLTIKPTNKQHLAYEALRDENINTLFFGGGAGGGKSWHICESRLINAIIYPGYKSFIGREELKRLMQSTFITFAKVCEYHNIPKNFWRLNGQYNYIEFSNGSRIDLLDLKYLPSDPLFERFGSLEYTDGAIEEAGEVHNLAFEVLKTRIGRHKNEEFNKHPSMIISGNPKKNWTYILFYKPYRDGTLEEDKKFVQALYEDNPYTIDTYGKQLRQIKDKQLKERLMYGNWEYDDDPSCLMSYDAICDMFTNKYIEGGDKYITADIARFGKDKTTIGYWNGYRLEKIINIRKNKITEAAEEIEKLRNDKNVQLSHILVDEDGIGGGVKDILGCKGFINNSRALKRQNFENLKSQCSFKIAEMINKAKVYILCDENDRNRIIEECEVIKKDNIDKDGRLSIIKKDRIKELIGRSPDYWDMIMMRAYFELRKPIEIMYG